MPIKVVVENWPISSWWKDYLPIFAAFATGFILPLLLGWIRDWYARPKLVLSYKHEPSYLLEAKIKGEGPNYHDAKYVRVLVANKGRSYAKDVRAYISTVKVKKRDLFCDVEFNVECLRLKWSTENATASMNEGVDIPNGARFFFDVLSLKQVGSGEPQRIVQCANMDIRFDRNMMYNKLQMNSHYQVEVFVTADGVKPVKLALYVSIGTTWQDLTVSLNG